MNELFQCNLTTLFPPSIDKKIRRVVSSSFCISYLALILPGLKYSSVVLIKRHGIVYHQSIYITHLEMGNTVTHYSAITDCRIYHYVYSAEKLLEYIEEMFPRYCYS